MRRILVLLALIGMAMGWGWDYLGYWTAWGSTGMLAFTAEQMQRGYYLGYINPSWGDFRDEREYSLGLSLAREGIDNNKFPITPSLGFFSLYKPLGEGFGLEFSLRNTGFYYAKESYVPESSSELGDLGASTSGEMSNFLLGHSIYVGLKRRLSDNLRIGVGLELMTAFSSMHTKLETVYKYAGHKYNYSSETSVKGINFGGRLVLGISYETQVGDVKLVPSFSLASVGKNWDYTRSSVGGYTASDINTAEDYPAEYTFGLGAEKENMMAGVFAGFSHKTYKTWEGAFSFLTLSFALKGNMPLFFALNYSKIKDRLLILNSWETGVKSLTLAGGMKLGQGPWRLAGFVRDLDFAGSKHLTFGISLIYKKGGEE